MKKLLLVVSLAIFLSMNTTYAQYEEAKNAIAGKYLLVDYFLPVNDGNLDLDQTTRGGELTYYRHLNDYLNFALPLKFAAANYPVSRDDFREDELYLGIDALLQFKYFKEDNLIAPYFHTGLGMVFDFDDEFASHVPVGAGLNIRLAKHFYIQGQIEYRIAFEDIRDHLNYGMGIFAVLGKGVEDAPPPDMDGDGITDALDRCPNVAGVAAFQGCPDTDGDGIEDANDDCPEEAGPVQLNGCPDSDEDGIANKDDRCPDEAGLASFQGCPDTDKDGVADPDDQCPEVAGLVRFNGCPDSDADGVPDNIDDCPDVVGLPNLNGCPDTDGDGVTDAIDKCPTTAGPASNDGCPEIKEEAKETLEFAMRAVQFDFGRATLKSRSITVLDEITEILTEYPNYSMRIGGHTDSVGGEEANQALSEKRAKRCFDYFVSKGVNASRLTYAGYGESQPLGDNNTSDGRAKNRRTEFEMYLK